MCATCGMSNTMYNTHTFIHLSIMYSTHASKAGHFGSPGADNLSSLYFIFLLNSVLISCCLSLMEGGVISVNSDWYLVAELTHSTGKEQHLVRIVLDLIIFKDFSVL